MRVAFRKKSDGRHVLVCTRSDGSKTWTRLRPGFAIHDLAHLAVEAALGIADGFFGLIASGWSIADFSEAGAARRLPPGAVWVELVVAQLQGQLAGGIGDSRRALNEALVLAAWAHGLAERDGLSPADYERVGAAFRELRGRWSGIEPGACLELELDPESTHAPSWLPSSPVAG